MADEADAPKVVEIEIPPPISALPKRNWRDPAPNIPFGHQILDAIDPERTMLYPDQQRKVLAIKSEEALKEMLYADLGDSTSPDIMTAERVFGKVLMTPLEIPALLMTWKFYVLSQAMLAIEDGKTLHKDKTLSGAERIKGYQIQLEAIRATIHMTDRITKLAQKLGHIKSQGKKKKLPQAPRTLRPAPSLAPVERISV